MLLIYRHNIAYKGKFVFQGMLEETPQELEVRGEGSYDSRHEAWVDVWGLGSCEIFLRLLKCFLHVGLQLLYSWGSHLVSCSPNAMGFVSIQGSSWHPDYFGSQVISKFMKILASLSYLTWLRQWELISVAMFIMGTILLVGSKLGTKQTNGIWRMLSSIACICCHNTFSFLTSSNIPSTAAPWN